MLVGLLSDSHDRVDATTTAVQMLLAEGAVVAGCELATAAVMGLAFT